ncbi:MAG: TIGR04076 family protein [Desulfurococcaceae archaeon]
MSYRVRVMVKEVKGSCALGLKLGDEFVVEKFYVQLQQNTRICLHALVGMSSLLLPFLKGVSARELGIGTKDDVGYVQCPDPGRPYTTGGTVVFELKREKID